jgi:hypothetical protein
MIAKIVISVFILLELAKEQKCQHCKTELS